MLRTFFVCLALGLGPSVSGCRSCSSCHDFDSPVANCSCSYCNGCQRAGSIRGRLAVTPTPIEFAPSTPEPVETPPDEFDWETGEEIEAEEKSVL